MWPDSKVIRFVEENFIPVRLHVREQAADFKKVGSHYGALWTPTTLFLDPDGVERHRIEGFLPLQDFLAQLELGLGHIAFQGERWKEAEQHFEVVLAEFPRTEAAAEAQYWAGVSRYKESGDGEELTRTALAFEQRYGDTVWARKASVWKPRQAA